MISVFPVVISPVLRNMRAIHQLITNLSQSVYLSPLVVDKIVIDADNQGV
ncbi:hypothetical protein [[Haemophilus] ducreyi]|nr:hypothetical protein [[Haemophilus] ducreyi]